MARGIDPDLLVVRSDFPIEESIINKLSVMCGLDKQDVIPSATVNSIYEVPVNYHTYGVGERIVKKLKLHNNDFDLSQRQDLLNHINHSTNEKTIAIVGKYTDLEDAYYSINEGAENRWIST